MFTIRNKHEEIIIVYDNDEIAAIRVVNLLIERGYDNIYLLSGGLNYALSTLLKGITDTTTIESIMIAPTVTKIDRDIEYLTHICKSSLHKGEVVMTVIHT
ncbi:hypothetical protein NPIL_129221 [Nephila pilipes]|uniref:Rhodanese domain-containing protein n=1 Tax=Nephila pilipes TaxID=299642 RepID=A0A8X6I6H4_NEPPI|nr:hypothetical protein NPIL_129221 [Nephila pilipes]